MIEIDPASDSQAAQNPAADQLENPAAQEGGRRRKSRRHRKSHRSRHHRKSRRSRRHRKSRHHKSRRH